MADVKWNRIVLLTAIIMEFLFLFIGNCGVPKIQKARVIAGVNAEPGSWPWQAALRYRKRFRCGASLVSPFWVATAAHCVSRVRNSYLTVTLGELYYRLLL